MTTTLYSPVLADAPAIDPRIDGAAAALLMKLAAAHPQNVTKAVAPNAATDRALLKQGGSYLLHCRPDPTALATPTGVYWALHTAGEDASKATTDSDVLTSADGYLQVNPDKDTTLSLLRVGGADVVVHVIGLTPASTTALP